MIKFLIALALVCGLGYCGATVKLGNKTFFGHVRAIWSTDEAKDLVEGVKEKGAPVVDKIERGVKAGVDEVRKPEPAADAGTAR